MPEKSCIGEIRDAARRWNGADDRVVRPRAGAVSTPEFLYVQDSNAANRFKQRNRFDQGMTLNRQKQRSEPTSTMGTCSNDENLIDAGLKLPLAVSSAA